MSVLLPVDLHGKMLQASTSAINMMEVIRYSVNAWKGPSNKLTFPSARSENHLFYSIRVKFQTKKKWIYRVFSQYNLFRLMCVYMNLMNIKDNHCTWRTKNQKNRPHWVCGIQIGQPNQIYVWKEKKIILKHNLIKNKLLSIQQSWFYLTKEISLCVTLQVFIFGMRHTYQI